MGSGVFVTFFDEGEAFERELPPVGPLDRVVVRQRQLVADRASVQQSAEADVDIARWLEAELELQRALGEEPGGTKRGEMRITAQDGVFLRFAVFGEAHERDLVPELGPYAVVVIGRRGVEADGQLLATRPASELAAWELTSGAGDAAAGSHKPDIAFRTAGTTYHASLAPAPARTPVVEAPPLGRTALTRAPGTPAPAQVPTPPRSEPPPFIPVPTPPAPPTPPPAAFEPEPAVAPPAPVEAPPPPAREREVYTPPAASYAAPVAKPVAEEPPALTVSDLELIERLERERAEETLRARVQEEERRRLGVDETDEAATTWAMRYRPQPASEAPPVEYVEAGGGFGALLWRLRFALIGLLLVGAGVYGFTLLRGGGVATVTGQQQIQTVGIAQRVSGVRWDYVVNGVQRTATAGSARARGTYYVVRIGVTNKGTEGAQLSPSDFVLVDATGTEYRAESVSSGAYYGSGNTQSQSVWPQGFPVGKTTSIAVMFDVSASLPRGNLLAISELPQVRVKLD